MANLTTIWLGRHGEAVDPDASGTDFERVLSSLGRRQVGDMAQWLLSREAPPDLILHSPLVRARQTAETIAAQVPGGGNVLLEPALSPGFSTQNLLTRLQSYGVSRVVCIGHQPDIGRCLGELLGGGRALISPGTMSGIEFHGQAAVGAGSLRWMADPFWFGG
jgi:phosphohistidine phosphatase